jgi:proteasome lid subunit RPN8/RPN11
VLLITDIVIEQLWEGIGAHAPERGGALLGPPNATMISEFVPDPQALVSRASYLPSHDLVQRVQDRERERGLELKGVAHSHPGSLDVPSGPDRYAFGKGLELNPHMATFVAPIITRDRMARSGVANEVDIGLDARMTVYTAYRGKSPIGPAPVGIQWPSLGWTGGGVRGRNSGHGGQEIDLVPLACSVLPVGQHMYELARGVSELCEEQFTIAWGTLLVSGIHFLSATLRLDRHEVIVLFAPSYPVTKPAVLMTDLGQATAETVELSFAWPIGTTGLLHVCRNEILSVMRAGGRDAGAAASVMALSDTAGVGLGAII